jgi:2'-5' RNA ligase
MKIYKVAQKEYGWSHINVSEEIIKKHKEFCDQIDEDDLYVTNPDKDPNGFTHGIEAEPHVTVKWGIHTEDHDEFKNAVGEEAEGGEVELTNVSIFDNDDYDVLKVEVKSDALSKLNKSISDNLECTDTHPTYNPHVTLAYLKKGRGKKYKDSEHFKGVTFNFNELHFQDAKEEKSKINLK